MSISYSIDPTEKLVYVTFPEIIDLASSLDTMRALAVDEQLGADFGILVDLRAAKPVPSFQEARLIAATASQSKLFLHHPTALVVSQKVQYGMGNMISIIAGLQGALVQAFYEMEEAKTWLQVHLR
jgi:hypothetical protein